MLLNINIQKILQFHNTECSISITLTLKQNWNKGIIRLCVTCYIFSNILYTKRSVYINNNHKYQIGIGGDRSSVISE